MSVSVGRSTLSAANAVAVSSAVISRNTVSAASAPVLMGRTDSFRSAACFSSIACASSTWVSGTSSCTPLSRSSNSCLQSMMRKSLSAAKSIRKRNIGGLASSSFLSTATQRTLSTRIGRTQFE